MDPQAIAVPFRLEQNLMVFQGRLESGRSLELTLDTCAWPHVVRRDLARELGWLTGRTERSEGAGGSQTTEAALIPEIRLETLLLSRLPALCDPLVGPVSLDLMLGGPMLEDWVSEIDYPAGMLRFHAPERWSCPAADQQTDVFALEVIPPGLPYLSQQLRLNGRQVPIALLDTGNNSAIVLSAGLARHLGLAPERSVIGGGFGGQELSFGLLTLQTVELGSQRWQQVQALILPPEASALLARPDRALIGNALLRDCVATWAVQAGKWVLKRI